MARSVFFQAYAWSDDSKTNLLTPTAITRFTRVFRHKELNQPYSYELSVFLSDKIANNIGRGTYVELYLGKTTLSAYPPSGQTLWLAGYVETLTRNPNRGNEYAITLHSASLHLAHLRDMGALEMDYPKYGNFVAALNGIGSGPGKLGILSGSGWTANWIHKAGLSIPGTGDSWHTDWASKLLNLNTLMQIYGLQWRERAGATSRNGVIDCGDLTGSSPIVYYGGDSLAVQTGAPAGARANAATAQAQALNVVQTAAYTEDTTAILNVCWPLGAGSGSTLVTIAGSTGFKGPPLSSKGKLQYGWSSWQPSPGGTTYYIQASNKQTYDNQQFSLIAEQQQDGNWAYGVVDLTSVNGSATLSAQGVREVVITRKKTKDPNVLLSEALGTLVTNGRPIATWQFVVKPNRDSTGVPSAPLPGQVITMNYAGKVHQSIEIDDNVGSATYGQYIGAGDYTYLSYPNTNDPGLIEKAKKVIVLEDEWSGRQYIQTLTLGKMQKNVHHLVNSLADDIEDHKHNKHRKHGFIKGKLDHLSFKFSQNPDAYEDDTRTQVTFTPGSTIVSNVPNDSFLDDHHSIEYSINVVDDKQSFQCWLFKPSDGTLEDAKGSRNYPMFRLMWGNQTPDAGRGCGFFLNHTDGTVTKLGDLSNRRVFDAKGRLRHTGVYRVKITASGGKYEAHIARVENGSADWQHELIAVWHDSNNEVPTRNGAIGFHLVGGAANATLGSIILHPHTKKSGGHTGGHGKGSTHVHPSGGGGHRHVTYDQAAGTFVTSHRHHTTGSTHGVGGVVHGPFHPTSAIVSSVSGANPVTIGFSPALPNNALKTGWIVYDGAGTFCFIKDVLKNASKQVTGFTTPDAGAAAFTVGEQVMWDPLENESDPIHGHGHKRFGVYNPPRTPDDPKQGWALVDRAADAPSDGSGDFIIYPDGSHSKGDKPITQANGAVINVAELIVGGEHLAKGLEKEGAVLFDAGEYDSTTQSVTSYAAGSSVSLLPSTNGFYGGSAAAIQASWVDTTQDTFAIAGDADSILQLSCGTYGGTIYTTTQWSDQQILTENKDKNGNQKARTYTVKKDVTFSLPVYVGVLVSPSTMRLGNVLTYKSYDPATKKLFVKIDDGALSGVVAGDTFVFNPGGTDQETVTASSADTVNKAIVLTADPVNTHTVGETIVQKTSHGTVVQSAGLLDGTTSLGQVTAAADAIAVGFYGYTKDASGTKTFKWYRGSWGDPEFAAHCPYAPVGTMHYIGHLPSNNDGDWLDLHCKAHQLGLHWGQTASQPPVTIVGVELAVYSASPGAGVTVYFDAHSQGSTSNGKKTHAATIDAAALAIGTVKGKHKHPNQNADMHHHSDFVFWSDTGNVLHWTTGSLAFHNNTILAINGGTEDTPNAGVTGVAAGDYLVFNSTSSAVLLADPIRGTVNVPAYSASGGSGGQSTGFALVSESYPFTKRVSGAAVKTGLPDGLSKIGKVGHTPDDFTGELPVHTHHGSGKKHGKHVRNGAVGRGKHHRHNYVRHQHDAIRYKVKSSTAGSCVIDVSLTPGVTSGQAIADDGIVLWLVKSSGAIAGQNPPQVNVGTFTAFPGDFIGFDAVAGVYRRYAANFNPNLIANIAVYVIGRISPAPDKATKQYKIQTYHYGPVEAHGDMLANGAVTHSHLHPHHPTRKRNRMNSAQYNGGTGGLVSLSGTLAPLAGIGRLAGALKP